MTYTPLTDEYEQPIPYEIPDMDADVSDDWVYGCGFEDDLVGRPRGRLYVIRGGNHASPVYSMPIPAVVDFVPVG